MNVCDVGTVLRQLRKSHGLTQSELGNRLGLSKAVISKYENGLGFPANDILISIAKYFGVTTDYLLGVQKQKTLDASGLTDKQIDLVHNLIEELKRGNNS